MFDLFTVINILRATSDVEPLICAPTASSFVPASKWMQFNSWVTRHENTRDVIVRLHECHCPSFRCRG